MPDDIVFNILVLLPVAALLRFKSVCKSWYSLIESSYFISQHHHHQCDNLMVRYLSDRSDRGSFLLHSSRGNFELPCNLDLPPSSYFQQNDKPNSLNLVASCNGIICLSKEKFRGDLSNDRDIILWNPATKQLRALPDPLLRYPPNPLDRSVLLRYPPNPLDRSVLKFVSFGFGYDIKTNDYKVVRIIILKENCVLTKSVAEVYSLRSNSWRIIDVGRDGPLPVDYILFDPQSPYHHNGIYCWFVATHDHNNHLSLYSILSFNFSDEVFRTIPLPDMCSPIYHFRRDYIRCVRLALVKEDLACILIVGDPVRDCGDCHFEIWVLNEYSIVKESSWTKRYTIDTKFTITSAFPIAIGFCEFFVVVLGGSLCLCDPVTQETKDLKIRNVSNSLQVASYKESLVSVGERR